jgi:5-hydroxyisourate hydrolase
VKLSVHVVDCASGVSAAGVEIRLRRRTETDWQYVTSGRTDADGRLAEWHDQPLENGTYQLEFDLDGYYAELGTVPLHPRAIVEFRVTDPTVDLHLPLLVTANSYQTYRGCC